MVFGKPGFSKVGFDVPATGAHHGAVEVSADARALRRTAGCWLLLGVAVSAVGVLMLVAAGLFVAQGTRTAGTVVEHQRRGGYVDYRRRRSAGAERAA